MIALFTLVAGIALLYNPGWFVGAGTIGYILAAVGGLRLALQVIILTVAVIVGSRR